MTSASGHIMNYAFPANYKNWNGFSPRALFEADLNKNVTENAMNIKKTLGKNRKFLMLSFGVSPPVELKLRLHTTHPSDFWYGKRCWQYLLQCQKSSAWVVCRRRYDLFVSVLTLIFLTKLFYF